MFRLKRPINVWRGEEVEEAAADREEGEMVPGED